MGADTKAAPEFRRALARQFSTERNFNLPTTNLEDRKISPLHFSSYLQISINKGRKKQEQARALNLSVCLPACLLCSALNPGAPSADISSRMGFLHQRLGGTSRDLPFVRRFKPREIEAATSGFSTALETGGPRGTAYRARFADGLVATVRRAAGGDHEEQEDAFYRELQLLGRLNHRHVVRLRGFSEGHNRFLVFDQMENRSLKECLHDPLRTPLNWRTRLQVAIDVAAALEYLYYFCDPPVFHVTVNSSNVMMDADFVAKLSDVTVVAHDSSQVSEEQIHERRSDLAFQYGVLLLELVTGQSPGGGDGELVRWVQEPGFAGSMQRMVDADLGGTYDAGELRDLVIVARLCTRLGNGAAVVSIPQVLRYMHAKVDEKNR